MQFELISIFIPTSIIWLWLYKEGKCTLSLHTFNSILKKASPSFPYKMVSIGPICVTQFFLAFWDECYLFCTLNSLKGVALMQNHWWATSSSSSSYHCRTNCSSWGCLLVINVFSKMLHIFYKSVVECSISNQWHKDWTNSKRERAQCWGLLWSPRCWILKEECCKRQGKARQIYL